MIFGHVSGPGARTVWLLLVVGGLLIWAGRSHAARLDEGSEPAVAAPPPQLSRIDGGDVEARLVISGQMVLLRLRGGDLAALAARLQAAAEREIAIRIDGEEVLAAELRELRFEGDPLEDRAHLLDPARITLGPLPVVAAAVSTRVARPDDSGEEHATQALEPEELVRPFRAETAVVIPEPASAALLAGGLVGLGLAGGRARS